MLSETIQVTLKVANAFAQLKIPYLIGGSFASAIHGVVRATMDADMVADIESSQVSSLVALLEKEFYINDEMILDAIHHKSSFNLIHLETLFKVDVFILKQRPYDQNQMQRRIRQPIGDFAGEQPYFCTAEDIILAKLEWYRAGGEISDRQWRDILGVLQLQEDRLDFEYLKKWANALRVQDLLQRAIQSVQGK